MKNSFYGIALAIFVFCLAACESNDFIESQADETGHENYTELGTSSIYGMSINDGVSTKSVNNILVFPDWDTFKQTAIDLGNQRKDGIEMMNQEAGDGMSDKDYKSYIDSRGFDEDQPYIDFEDQFDFYSLRNEINKRELQWLSRRTDNEDWDEAVKTDPDPDDSFVWEEERSLLNPQFEVIVKNDLGEKIIYKWYPNGYFVKIRNMNERALQTVNSTGPIQNLDLSWVSPEEFQDSEYGNNPSDRYPGPGYGYGNTNPGNGGGSDPCISENTRYMKRFKTGRHRRMKIIQRTRHRTFAYDPKVRATTRSFHKFAWPIKWMPDLANMKAKLHANFPLTCDHIGTKPDDVIRARRAYHVDAIWDWADMGYDNYVPRMTKGNVFSTHERYDYVEEIDMYDHEIQ